MKRCLIIVFFSIGFAQVSFAQIDLGKLDINSILGQVMKVQRGFAPKFFLGNTPLQKIQKVEEILGLKQNEEVNRLFKTFKTGRTVYRIAAFTGSAIAVYGFAKKANAAAQTGNYQGAIVAGLTSIGTGLAVKFLTKSASYKAVDIFNGIAVKKIRDIFSIAPASNTVGVGLYVKL
ncbi:MAG: hypothetical protein NVSMB45_10720 [Ginsengibacter sp.]